MEECGTTFCSAEALNRVFVRSAEKVESRLGLGCSSGRSYLMAVIGSFTPITIHSRQSRFVNLPVLFCQNMQFFDQIMSEHRSHIAAINLILKPILGIDVINIWIAWT